MYPGSRRSGRFAFFRLPAGDGAARVVASLQEKSGPEMGVRRMDFVLYIQISRVGEQECHLSLRGMRWKSSGMSGCDFGAGGGGLTFGGGTDREEG